MTLKSGVVSQASTGSFQKTAGLMVVGVQQIWWVRCENVIGNPKLVVEQLALNQLLLIDLFHSQLRYLTELSLSSERLGFHSHLQSQPESDGFHL